MVAQDPPPTSSGEGVLLQERRSMTAAAIRRGDIKISEPIPYEDEYIPSTVASPAQHRTQHSGGSSNSQTSNITAPQQQPAVSDGGQVQIRDVLPEEEELPPESPPSEPPRSPPLRHKRASLSMREDSETQRQTQQLQNRHTTPVDQILSRESMGPTRASPIGSGRGSLQKRGKRTSGIKSVFKRLFSRREKSSLKGRVSPQRTTPPRQHGYHTSDPLPVGGEDKSKEDTQPRRNTSPRLPRQSLLPSEQEYTLSKPPQRLPFPMNINAPAEASPPHHYTSFETSPRVHRRRATLPSIVVSASDQQALKAYWGKSESQLASPAEQSSGRTPSPLIGMAISSGMTGVNQKRRSRSAGALYEMAKLDEQAELRRRSAEIQYWRRSFQAERVGLSETGPSSECRSVEDSSLVSHRNDSVADASVSDALADNGSSVRNEHIQHFDFGDLKADDLEGLAHQAQARGSELPLQVPSQLPSPEKSPLTPIDQRLSQLESSVLGLTNSVHELTGRAHRQTVLLGQVPEAKRARSYSPTPPVDPQTKAAYEYYQKQPSLTIHAHHKDSYTSQACPQRIEPSPPSSTSTISTTKPSMRRVPESFLSSPSDSGGAPLLRQKLSPESLSFTPTTPPSAQHLSRSASAPAPSGTSPLYSNPSTQDQTLYTHLAPLYSALQYERLQRKALESKVEKMTQQLHDITTILSQMRANVSHAATMYPTPSPDRVYTNHGAPDVLDPVAAHRQTSRFSASAYGDSEVDNMSESHGDEEYDDTHERVERDRHRHVHVHDARDLDSIRIRQHGDDDFDEYGSPTEKWTTPREEKSGWVHAGNLQMQEEIMTPRSVEGEMF